MDSVSTLPRSGLGEQRRHKPGKVVKLRGYLMPLRASYTTLARPSVTLRSPYLMTMLINPSPM
jgi:hypothetical protein